MITILTIALTIFTGILTLVMSLGIITFGNLISRTPDMLERHGDRKEPTDIPARHARAFATAFMTIYIVGAIVMLLGWTTAMMVIGGVTMFAALLFAATIMLYSMQIYKLMKKNEVEFKGSMVA